MDRRTAIKNILAGTTAATVAPSLLTSCNKPGEEPVPANPADRIQFGTSAEYYGYQATPEEVNAIDSPIVEPGSYPADKVPNAIARSHPFAMSINAGNIMDDAIKTALSKLTNPYIKNGNTILEGQGRHLPDLSRADVRNTIQTTILEATKAYKGVLLEGIDNYEYVIDTSSFDTATKKKYIEGARELLVALGGAVASRGQEPVFGQVLHNSTTMGNSALVAVEQLGKGTVNVRTEFNPNGNLTLSETLQKRSAALNYRFTMTDTPAGSINTTTSENLKKYFADAISQTEEGKPQAKSVKIYYTTSSSLTNNDLAANAKLKSLNLVAATDPKIDGSSIQYDGQAKTAGNFLA